jgi:very-short-patch-repair endonuclease
MINEIYINGALATHEFPRKQFKNGFQIRCVKCKQLVYRKWFDLSVLNSRYTCKPCVLINNNPMANPSIKKKHEQILQSKEYRTKLSDACSGDKNGFYGKKHTTKTIEKIKKGFVDWKDNLTEDEYRQWTETMSAGQKQSFQDNPEFYKKIKRKAARTSHKAQFKNWKLNKIERIVYDFLQQNSAKQFTPSVVLGHKQFDFGCKDSRILIEVDGDYWHGNPGFFNEEGTDGKRQLNEIQKQKIQADIQKDNWALTHNFKLIRVWETEILNGTFVDKLKEVL